MRKRSLATKETRAKMRIAHLGKRYENANKRSPIYSIWRSMRGRCFSKNNSSYSNYGGRGITISFEWSNFKNFNKDMNNSYRKGLSLERIDNNGHYNKMNCKWATKEEQNNNRRNNIKIKFKKKLQTASLWSRELGIKYSTIRRRLGTLKWSIKDSLTA